MPPGRTSCLLALPVELWSIVLAEYDSMALAFAEQICHAALHASRVRTKLKISAHSQQSAAVLAAALARDARFLVVGRSADLDRRLAHAPETLRRAFGRLE